MVKSGTGITKALELIGESPDEEVAEAASEVLKRLERGEDLATSFGRSVDPLTGSLLGIAQRTGALTRICESLAQRTEEVIRQREELKSALLYPVGVLSLTLLVGVAIATVLLPQLLPFITGMGVDPPWPTKVLLMVYHARWLLANLIILPISALVLVARTQPERFLEVRRQLLEQTPVLGPALTRLTLAHICQDLCITVRAGLGLHESLRLVAESCRFPRLKQALSNLAQRIKQGEGLGEAVRATPELGPMLSGALALSEEAGRLPELLHCASVILKSDAEFRLGRMVDLMEPAVMCLVSVMVGFLALAGLLPIYQVITAPL